MKICYFCNLSTHTKNTHKAEQHHFKQPLAAGRPGWTANAMAVINHINRSRHSCRCCRRIVGVVVVFGNSCGWRQHSRHQPRCRHDPRHIQWHIQQQQHSHRFARRPGAHVRVRWFARLWPILSTLYDADCRLLCGVHLRVHRRSGGQQFRDCGGAAVAAHAYRHEFLYRQSGGSGHPGDCVLLASHTDGQYIRA